jgi:tRNA dimethylallyltransferase
MAGEVQSAFPLPPGTLLIAGPTAVGKTEISLRIAQEMGGEIISVDSMQVYRGMDIGTAKPSEQQRKQIRHHLIDIVDITESFDVAQFVQRGRQALTEIYSRRSLPILSGGTGLYFKALTEGLGSAPPRNNTLREQLERASVTELLKELGERDPVTYERIDQKNRRRVIRAVEVIRLTGKAYSAQKAHWETTGNKSGDKPHILCLTREPNDLGSRINERVEAMFRMGLIAETEALLKKGLEQSCTAMQALGYRQVAEYLQGKRSLPDTIELVKTRTRQFAKRQMTLFRNQPYVEWIQLNHDPITNFQKLRSHAITAKKNYLSYGPEDGIILKEER